MSLSVVLLFLTLVSVLLPLLLLAMVVDVLLLHVCLSTEGGLLSVVHAPALLALVGSVAPGEACCAVGSKVQHSIRSHTGQHDR